MRPYRGSTGLRDISPKNGEVEWKKELEKDRRTGMEQRYMDIITDY